MSDPQLSFRKSANIDRVTDKRKDSLFRLVDTDGSGTIDAQEFAVLYDAIKKDLAEELEKEAELQKEASSAKRRLKMLLLFVAVLVSFLAASVAANFAVIFTVVDQAITTTTTSSGVLEVKGSGTIAKTATASQDVPFLVAPVLDMDTLSQVKSVKVKYAELDPINGNLLGEIEAALTVVAVRKHNSTFVEFVTDVPGETVEALNGAASFVRYPTMANGLKKPLKHALCSANATCSALHATGIDVEAAMELATQHLLDAGFVDEARRLQTYHSYDCAVEYGWRHWDMCGFSWHLYWQGLPAPWPAAGWIDPCAGTWLHAENEISDVSAWWYQGYDGTRHVVFMLHGKYMDGDGMWNYHCTPGTSTTCHILKKDSDFQSLLFILPTGNMIDNGTSAFHGAPGWSYDANDGSSYLDSAYNLAALLCGNVYTVPGDKTMDTCGDLSLSPYFGSLLKANSRIMAFGYSDGAGFATYLNHYYYKVTKALAIDYWGYASYHLWIPRSGIPNTNLKIYTNCMSHIYTICPACGIFKASTRPAGAPEDTIPEVAKIDHLLVDEGDVTEWYGYDPATGAPPSSMIYREWKFNDGKSKPTCPRYVKYAVHGINAGEYPSPPPGGGDAQWTDATKCQQNIVAWDYHINMGYHAPVFHDLKDFAADPYSPAAGTRRRELFGGWKSRLSVAGLAASLEDRLKKWDPCADTTSYVSHVKEMLPHLGFGRRLEDKTEAHEKIAEGVELRSDVQEERRRMQRSEGYDFQSVAYQESKLYPTYIAAYPSKQGEGYTFAALDTFADNLPEDLNPPEITLNPNYIAPTFSDGKVCTGKGDSKDESCAATFLSQGAQDSLMAQIATQEEDYSNA